MGMSHLASKLKAHKLDLSKDLFVHLVLISLPTQFSQFKVSYNCQKETWSLNELISHCVQEEERLKQEKIESAHLTGTSKDKGKKMKKDKEAVEVPYQKKQHKKKKKRLMVVSFVELRDIRRSNVPTIMLGVQRKVHFLI